MCLRHSPQKRKASLFDADLSSFVTFHTTLGGLDNLYYWSTVGDSLKVEDKHLFGTLAENATEEVTSSPAFEVERVTDSSFIPLIPTYSLQCDEIMEVYDGCHELHCK